MQGNRAGAEAPDLMTVREVAALLRVTDRTVRRMIHRGELTARRLGARAIRVERGQLESALRLIPSARAGPAVASKVVSRSRHVGRPE